MRRAYDFYPTPAWATETLLEETSIARCRAALECCSGKGDISDVLKARGIETWTNDVDGTTPAGWHYDASERVFWDRLPYRPDYVISNPPFNCASKIIPLAYEYAEKKVAMLLRLSFLEPVEDRGEWLNEHPLTKLIVLPRISFTGNGKTDSVTCAWMIWDKRAQAERRIIVAQNPKFAKLDHGQLEMVI